MTQLVIAESDAHNDTWKRGNGDSVELFADIAVFEDDPNAPGDPGGVDETHIVSSPSPTSDVYVAKMQSFINPEDLGETWTLKFRAQKMIDDATQLDLTVQLRQNYVDEIDQGELLFEELFEALPFGFADYEIVMTTPNPLVPDDPPDPDIDPTTINQDELYVRFVAQIS